MYACIILYLDAHGIYRSDSRLFHSPWRPQATRRDGRGCVHWAARFGRTEVLKLLLSCQACPKGAAIDCLQIAFRLSLKPLDWH